MLLFLLSVLLAQQPGPPGSATISGQLLDSNGAPAAGIRIGVMWADGDGALTTLSNLTQTDDQGRYRLEGVTPGRYLIIAGPLSFPSYFPGVATRGEGRTVTIAAGQSVSNMDFKLAAGTNINGGTGPLSVNIKVDDGSAAPRLEIDINGVITAVGGGAVSRLPELRPGRNLVTVTRVQLGYYLKSIYYGGADLTRGPLIAPANPTGAPIEVVLTKQAPAGAPPGVKVSGRVTELAFPLGSDFRLLLTELSRTGAPVVIGRGFTNSMDVQANGKDGAFEIRGVAPGRYTLEFVSCFAFESNTCESGVTFDVAKSDVTNLELKVAPKPVPRTGRGRPPVRLSGNSVTLMNGMVQLAEGAVPTFEIDFTALRGPVVTHAMMVSEKAFFLQLPEGEYRASVSGLPQGYAVESITGGPLDLTEPFLVTKGGIADRITGAALNTTITIRLKAAPPSGRNVDKP